MLWDDLKPVLVAVAVGVMVGAERERSHGGAKEQFGGVRTFAILAVTGALAALVSPLLVAAGFVMVGVLVALGYWRTIKTHPGSTTAVAGLATYLLGALAREAPGLAVGVGVLVVVLLLSKERLHRLLRDVVSDAEMADAVKLLVIVFVVLPLLPDRPLGPYGVLNPFRIWRLVVTVVGLGWVGYLGVRVLGAKRGLLVSGLASGFVSASATTAAMGRLAVSEPRTASAALAGALAASVSTLVQLFVVVGIFSRPVALALLGPSVAALAVLLVGLALVLRWPASLPKVVLTIGEGAQTAEAASDPPSARGQVRAFALTPALVLAGVITASVMVSRWAADAFGTGSAVLVAAAAGFADGHAGAVSAAALAADGAISTPTAAWAAAASIGTNTLTKVVLAFTAGGRRFGVAFTAAALGAALAFVAAAAFLS